MLCQRTCAGAIALADTGDGGQERGVFDARVAAVRGLEREKHPLGALVVTRRERRHRLRERCPGVASTLWRGGLRDGCGPGATSAGGASPRDGAATREWPDVRGAGAGPPRATAGIAGRVA